jgi:hypothetical protein
VASLASPDCLLEVPVKDDKESGQHFSLVVGPVLAAFTLPTIALIATTTPPPSHRNVVLSFLVVSTGLLLASFQLAVGRLFRDTPGWGAVRATLAFAGLISLATGLIVLAWPSSKAADWVFLALLVLAAGVLVPIAMNVYQWAKALRKRKRMDNEVAERKRSYRAENPTAQSLCERTSDESDKRVCELRVMQTYPQANSIAFILDSICRPYSRTEQDEALRAAIYLLPKIADPDRARLSLALQLLNASD